MSGCSCTFILRPLVSTSTVPSSFLPTITPYAFGGWVSFSTSSRSERDVLTRLAQRVAQLLVLGRLLGQLALGLEQPLLERTHPVGGVGEAGAQVGVLLTQQRELRFERTSVVLLQLVSVSIRFRHRSSPVG